MDAINQLRNNVRFFNNNKSLKSNHAAVSHANNLLAKGMEKLEGEFKQILNNYRFIIS